MSEAPASSITFLPENVLAPSQSGHLQTLQAATAFQGVVRDPLCKLVKSLKCPEKRHQQAEGTVTTLSKVCFVIQRPLLATQLRVAYYQQGRLGLLLFPSLARRGS